MGVLVMGLLVGLLLVLTTSLETCVKCHSCKSIETLVKDSSLIGLSNELEVRMRKHNEIADVTWFVMRKITFSNRISAGRR